MKKEKPAPKKVEAPVTTPPKKVEAAPEKKMTGCCGPTKR